MSSMNFTRAHALVLLTLANLLASGPADATAQGTPEAHRDRFVGNRWVFVTPEGNAFLTRTPTPR